MIKFCSKAAEKAQCVFYHKFECAYMHCKKQNLFYSMFSFSVFFIDSFINTATCSKYVDS